MGKTQDKKSVKASQNWIERIKKYLQGVKVEFKRITWPSKQELKSSTIIVLFTLAAVTTFLWLCNTLFTTVFEYFRQI